jgi:alpha-beta hydrolase superfamily lysophospholipase
VVLLLFNYWEKCDLHVLHPDSAPKNFDSVILASAAIHGNFPHGILLLALRLSAPLFPLWIPPFMYNPITADGFSADPNAVHANKRPPRRTSSNNENDEIQLDNHCAPLRLRTAAEVVDAISHVTKTAIPGFGVPFCLLHGTNDSISPISGAEYMWQTADTPRADREYHPLQGAYHNLFDADWNETSLQIVQQWIRKRLEQRRR